ncbi:hypothetical protein NA57DRAFT_23834, partial [Rhizodiscina lignyota]
MQTSGFSNAPVTRLLIAWIVVGSMLATLTDTKMFFYIQVVPHFWAYWQWWRVFIWQACYTNSTEVLFACLTLYHLRIIERLWGSRKFASFILLTLPYTSLLPPLILALILRPLSLNTLNYLPAGPTPLLFALLAQYHAAIPPTYRYKLATTATPTPSTAAMSAITLTFTSKTTSYFLPLQLSLAQLPGSLLCAGVGWAVGYAWRNEVLPCSEWRVPGWVVGEKGSGAGAQGRGGEGFEGLRRRL